MVASCCKGDGTSQDKMVTSCARDVPSRCAGGLTALCLGRCLDGSSKSSVDAPNQFNTTAERWRIVMPPPCWSHALGRLGSPVPGVGWSPLSLLLSLVNRRLRSENAPDRFNPRSNLECLLRSSPTDSIYSSLELSLCINTDSQSSDAFSSSLEHHFSPLSHFLESRPLNQHIHSH